MPIIFDAVVHFWIALIKPFPMTYGLFGFAEVRILPLFSAMTSFAITGLSNYHMFKDNRSISHFRSLTTLWFQVGSLDLIFVIEFEVV